MAKQLLLMVLTVLVSGVATVVNAQAVGAPSPTPEADKMIEYIETARMVDAQAESLEAFQAPPSDINAQQSNGSALRNIETQLDTVIANKELIDIAYSAYFKPRPEPDPARAQEATYPTPGRRFYEYHKQYFCSATVPEEKSAFACSDQQPPFVEYGDIKLSGLLEPTVYSTAQEVVADEVIRNLVNPLPADKLKQLLKDSENLDKSSSKQKEFAQYMATEAGLTAARYVLNQMYAMRVGRDVPDPNGGPNPVKSSVMQILERESTWRAGSKDWYDKVSTSSQEALLRELVMQNAFLMVQNYELLKSMQRNEVMAALSLATSVNANAALGDAFTQMVGGDSSL